MSSVMYQKGEQNFRRLFGDEVVDQALKNVTEFDREMHRLLFEYCFGELWSREGLSWKQRRLNTLCMMAAMNRSWEFEVHFRGAVRDGSAFGRIAGNAASNCRLCRNSCWPGGISHRQ